MVKEISTLNSKVENMLHLESNLKISSRLLKKLECEEMTRDTKRVNFGMSMEEENKTILPKKVVLEEKNKN